MSIAVVLIIVGLLVGRRFRTSSSLLGVSFLAVAGVTSLFAIRGYPSGRYAVVAGALIGFLVLSNVIDPLCSPWRRVLSGALLSWALVVGAGSYWSFNEDRYLGAKQPRPKWTEEVERWRDDPTRSMTIWPYPEWGFHVPDPAQIDALKAAYRKKGEFTLKTDDVRSRVETISVAGLPRAFEIELDLVAGEDTRAAFDGLRLELRIESADSKGSYVAVEDLDEFDGSGLFTLSRHSFVSRRGGRFSLADADQLVFALRGASMESVALRVREVRHRSPFAAF